MTEMRRRKRQQTSSSAVPAFELLTEETNDGPGNAAQEFEAARRHRLKLIEEIGSKARASQEQLKALRAAEEADYRAWCAFDRIANRHG